MKRYVLSLLLVVPFLMASQCTNTPGRYQLFMPPAGNPFPGPPEEFLHLLHRLDTATGRIQLFKFKKEFTKEEPYVEGPKTKACLEKLEVERIKNKKAIPDDLLDFERELEREIQQRQACRALDSTGGPSRPTGRYVMVEVPVVEKE